MDRPRRQADAAPCDVIVAEFVFGVQRCRQDAMHTVVDDVFGEEWRICNEHMNRGTA